MASNDTPELPEEIVTQICRGLVIQDIVHLSEVFYYYMNNYRIFRSRLNCNIQSDA